MDVYSACEEAYKKGYDDGYEAGKRDSVVYGRWIWKDFNYNGYYTLCCSECLETEGARETAHFCPNCGVCMILEE